MHLYMSKGVPYDRSKKVNSPSQKRSPTISFEALTTLAALCSMRSVHCALLTALCSMRSVQCALLSALNMPRAAFLCHGLRDLPRPAPRWAG